VLSVPVIAVAQDDGGGVQRRIVHEKGEEA